MEGYPAMLLSKFFWGIPHLALIYFHVLTFYLVLRQKGYFFVANITLASTSLRELSFLRGKGRRLIVGGPKFFEVL